MTLEYLRQYESYLSWSENNIRRVQCCVRNIARRYGGCSVDTSHITATLYLQYLPTVSCLLVLRQLLFRPFHSQRATLILLGRRGLSTGLVERIRYCSFDLFVVRTATTCADARWMQHPARASWAVVCSVERLSIRSRHGSVIYIGVRSRRIKLASRRKNRSHEQHTLTERRKNAIQIRKRTHAPGRPQTNGPEAKGGGSERPGVCPGDFRSFVGNRLFVLQLLRSYRLYTQGQDAAR
jgi:hypothetical protein